MKEILSILGGVAVVVGMIAVIAVGILWDEMEYEDRQEQERNKLRTSYEIRTDDI